MSLIEIILHVCVSQELRVLCCKVAALHGFVALGETENERVYLSLCSGFGDYYMHG